MKHLKKVLSLCLALAMIFSLARLQPASPAASESTATPEVTAEATAEPTPEATPEETPEESETAAEPVSFNIAALKGPTAMGLIRLMKDADSGEATANHYTFSLSGSPDEVTPGLLKGELDMACVPRTWPLPSMLRPRARWKCWPSTPWASSTSWKTAIPFTPLRT